MAAVIAQNLIFYIRHAHVVIALILLRPTCPLVGRTNSNISNVPKEELLTPSPPTTHSHLTHPPPSPARPQDHSQKIGDDKRLQEHLQLPIQRLNDYQLLIRVRRGYVRLDLVRLD